jgi:multidrug efflux system membrane fusion protein
VFIAHEGLIPLAVPLSAVTAENGQAYVWRVNPDHRLARTVVRLGPYGTDSVPVLEGLKPGDWVVAAGGHVLREGQEVRPVDRTNRVVNLTAKE